MTISVVDATQFLERRGRLERERFDHSELIIDRVSEIVGRALPSDLIDFYRQRIKSVGGIGATPPVRNGSVGWRTHNCVITWLLKAEAIPIFSDGCGSLFGVDISSASDHPAVYFFDHEDEFKKPGFAAGSSIGYFLLVLAETEGARGERRPVGWELAIDPDIDKCTRAPPIWLAG